MVDQAYRVLVCKLRALRYHGLPQLLDTYHTLSSDNQCCIRLPDLAKSIAQPNLALGQFERARYRQYSHRLQCHGADLSQNLRFYQMAQDRPLALQ
ncbi:hypothetical protein D3C76_1462640 [compost metagenome]